MEKYCCGLKSTSMADYDHLTGPESEDTSDFVSMYMSQSSCCTVRSKVSELSFSPSPAKPSHRQQHTGVMDSNNTVSTKLEHNGLSNSTGYMQNGSTSLLSSSSSSSSVPFCTGDNTQQCVKYLNQEITTLGLQSLYEDGSASVVRIINCCYEFLQKYQRSARLREDMEDRLQRSAADLEQQQASVSRQRALLEQQDRDMATIIERERQIKHKNKVLNNKLKAEKEEVKRLLSVIQHRDAQYKHELKKKERELIRLKERLHQLLQDKTDRRIGIEIANNLQRTGGKRGKWATNSRQEEELYRGVISTYEEKQKQLMVENHEMRQSLTHLQQQLVTMLNSPQKQDDIKRPSISLSENDEEFDEEEENDVNGIDESKLSAGVFQMPYDMVRDTIEQNLHEKCVKLRQYIRHLQKNTHSADSDPGVGGGQSGGSMSSKHSTSSSARRASTDEREHLRKQVERLREIIEQQEDMLQAQFDEADSAAAQRGNLLNESALWEDKEKLDRERQSFQQQQEHFHRERASFTEAAIRLAKERKAFEEEKAGLLSQQFNSLTPFRADGGSKRRPVSASAATSALTPNTGHKRNRKLPGTPSELAFRPYSTPLGQPSNTISPSTAELYRTLGLQHLSESPWPAQQSGGGASGADSPRELSDEHSEEDERRRRAEHADGVRLTLFMNQAVAAAAASTEDY